MLNTAQSEESSAFIPSEESNENTQKLTKGKINTDT